MRLKSLQILFKVTEQLGSVKQRSHCYPVSREAALLGPQLNQSPLALSGSSFCSDSCLPMIKLNLEPIKRGFYSVARQWRREAVIFSQKGGKGLVVGASSEIGEKAEVSRSCWCMCSFSVSLAQGTFCAWQSANPPSGDLRVVMKWRWLQTLWFHLCRHVPTVKSEPIRDGDHCASLKVSVSKSPAVRHLCQTPGTVEINTEINQDRCPSALRDSYRNTEINQSKESSDL